MRVRQWATATACAVTMLMFASTASAQATTTPTKSPAPKTTVSEVDNLGSWFGGLQWRDLGPYPVNDGEQYPQDKGYSEVNADVGYKVSPRLKVQASVYNLLNSKADSAAYFYASRLPGEPAEGVSGMQVHPLEPVSGRLTATALF